MQMFKMHTHADISTTITIMNVCSVLKCLTVFIFIVSKKTTRKRVKSKKMTRKYLSILQVVWKNNPLLR